MGTATLAHLSKQDRGTDSDLSYGGQDGGPESGVQAGWVGSVAGLAKPLGFPPPSCSLSQPHFVVCAVSSNPDNPCAEYKCDNPPPRLTYLLKRASVALRVGKSELLTVPCHVSLNIEFFPSKQLPT